MNLLKENKIDQLRKSIGLRYGNYHLLMLFLFSKISEFIIPITSPNDNMIRGQGVVQTWPLYYQKDNKNDAIKK